MPPNREILCSCPGCGAEIEVDPGMEEILRQSGCVVCGSSLSSRHFESIR